jgi:hypothetical protein
MELRFIIRDGKKILQFRNRETLYSIVRADDGGSEALINSIAWQDVPLIEETK